MNGMSSETPDLVLIDDDELVRATWGMAASVRHEWLAHFPDPDAFLSAAIPKDLPIFVDYSLGGGVKGTDVVRRLYDQGYRKLYLTTGMPLSPASVPACVLKVVGKEYPLLGNP
jgi:hypothetical protein